jgi:hypothetical protein
MLLLQLLPHWGGGTFNCVRVNLSKSLDIFGLLGNGVQYGLCKHRDRRLGGCCRVLSI